MKLLLICSLLLSLPVFALDPLTVQKIQDVLDAQTQQGDHVGVSVGLIDGGSRSVIYSGYSDYNKKIKLQQSDYFSIGSVTKTFTALLLAKAVEKNMTALETRVKSIIPIFKNVKAGDITLRELVTHSSGIQRDPKQLSSYGVLLPFEQYTKDQLIEEVKQASYTDVGDSEVYSNLGTGLLILCLEKLYGESYELALRREVLSPLKLDNIYIKIDDSQLPLMTRKYSEALDEVPVWKDLGILNGIGNIKSNTDLMLDYISAFMPSNNNDLSQSTNRALQALKKYKGYSLAYGWFKIDESLYWHNGSTAGFYTDVYFDTKLNKGLVLFSNTGSAVKCVLEIFLKNKDCSIKKSVIENYDDIKKYTGLYEVKELNAVFKIQSKEIGFPTLQVVGQPTAVRLRYTAKDNYQFFNFVGKVEFTYNEDGSIKGFNFSQGDFSAKAVKIKEDQ